MKKLIGLLGLLGVFLLPGLSHAADLYCNKVQGPTTCYRNTGQLDALGNQVFGWQTVAPLTKSVTYNVDVIGFAAYATPTDMVGICGGDTKTVLVTNFAMRINSTAAALQTIYIVKRSTADTGGTSATQTPGTADSTNPAATAVVKSYTAAPTTGTLASNVLIVQAASAVATAAGNPFSLASNNYPQANPASFIQPITLRGSNECLYFNDNGAALTSGFNTAYSIQWVEY